MAGDVALVAAVPQGRGVAEEADTGRPFVDTPAQTARGGVSPRPAEASGRVRQAAAPRNLGRPGRERATRGTSNRMISIQVRLARLDSLSWGV